MRWPAAAAFLVLLVLAVPAHAQLQGPVIPQQPGASQSPAASAPVETPQPGMPARAEPQSRDSGSLLGLPSWMERMAAGSSEPYAAHPILPPDLPERITLPIGTRIPVVLATPISSQFSHRGQSVVFRTSQPIFVSEDLEVPPGVEVRGRVIEVTRPGVFGKSGSLRVTVDRMLLPGAAAATLRAQLRSADINSRGRLAGEGRRLMDREGLVVLSVQGAVAGAQFGGKAAGIGAGAGAAVAAVLMMSKKGKDVFVSSGTSFSLRLQRDAELSAPAVYWAQQDYASRRAAGTPPAHEDRDESLDDGARPVLKRRGPVTTPSEQPQ